ncbi:MAG: phosphorybosylanthranilate isomerase [Rickettsiales bacterium]|nr:phosphorybosylanthranilate isomerase [Rickettsiales bacterium]
MVHLKGLPGSPRPNAMDAVVDAALRDARTLVEAGFDGLMVENFGDSPFYAEQVPPVTIAAMSRVLAELRALLGSRVRLGVNVLRNDARAALSIAAACGGDVIRVNVHSGARVTDQGLITGRAEQTLRLRRELGVEELAIWADLAVKHSAPLGQARPAAEEALELLERGGADALILTGAGTGKAVDIMELRQLRRSLPAGAALLVGSGVTANSVAPLLELADGVIVGTSVKEEGRTIAPVDPARAAALVAATRGLA